jgi:hypothetical protein
MFNPEKLLGGLIRSSTRGRRGGLGGLVSGGLAMGALGVAMEAVDHFMNTSRKSSPPPPAGPPPMPGSVSGTSGPAMTPPPPPPQTGTAPPAPPPSAATATAGSDAAVLLIRAMIAAAHADGIIDPQEREAILSRLQTVDLSPEEQAFITRELFSPTEMETIVNGVDSTDLARQVYTVSRMAIEVDTDAERQYLATLAERLGLDRETVAQIDLRLEME